MRTVPAPLPGAVAALLLWAPGGLQAQTRPPSRGDSADLVKAARNKQKDFEMFRQSRIPVAADREQGGCDQNIGRICIWFGGDEEADFPGERPEVEVARRELLKVLATAGEQVGDPWVFGQWVHYLVDGGDLAGAERVARACDLAASWWCSALLGYALHVRGDFVGAEAAFREAATTLPKEERERWLTARYILTRDGLRDLERGAPEERQRRWELFWRLSDPLFLVEGNDRLTDHFARWVEAENESDAENPQGMFWEEDLEETLVRYGRLVGYSRTHSPASMMRGGRMQLQDTRRVVGHHQPRSRGYLFPEEFLRSPSDIPPESWLTAPREARTWYAPPYAPDFHGLETQVGRFRRGDELLVVGAYRPTLPTGDTTRPGAVEPAQVPGPVQAGLFLVPAEGEEGGAEVRGTDASGVLTLTAPPGRYVSSLEVLDAPGRRAWRARQGITQVALVPGLVAVSDLLILEDGAPFPASLEEALPHVRAGVRLRLGERFTVVWEVYGLRVEQTAQVTLGFTAGRPAFLSRVGDFLGVLEPDRPVEVAFEDPGATGVQSAFRAITLELPDLEPGEYTLHLRLELPGREPAIASRPIVVEG